MIRNGDERRNEESLEMAEALWAEEHAEEMRKQQALNDEAGIDCDPCRPPTRPRLVTCVGCQDEYMSDQMQRVKDHDGIYLWRCKNHPDCNSAGYGFSILPVRKPQPVVKGRVKV